MLGFDALGRLTLGQVSIGATTAVLSASPGSFAVAGAAALLNTTILASSSLYAVTGNDAAFIGKFSAAVWTLSAGGGAAFLATVLGTNTSAYLLAGASAAATVRAAAISGGYAATGIGATFSAALLANAGDYTVSWQAFSDNEAIVCSSGSFAVTGNSTFLSYEIDRGGIGGAIVAHHAGDESRSGTPFTKQRYRDLVAQAEAAAAAERRAIELEESRKREAVRRAIAKAKAEIAEARAAEDEANAAQARQIAFAHALDAAAGARHAAVGMRHAARLADLSAMARSAKADEDDEAAIVQLLLAA